MWNYSHRKLVWIAKQSSLLNIAPYQKRDLTTVLDTDHNVTLTSTVDLSTPQDTVFADNTSCLLWPNIEPLAEGPYCTCYLLAEQ